MIVFLFGCPGSFLWEISEETIKMKFLFSVQLTETTHENQVESWNLCNKKRLKKKKDKTSLQENNTQASLIKSVLINIGCNSLDRFYPFYFRRVDWLN